MTYDRTRDLPKLMAILDPRKLDDTIEARRKLLKAIKIALRIERRLGLQGHFSYDLPRHRALLDASKHEEAYLIRHDPVTRNEIVHHWRSKFATCREADNGERDNALEILRHIESGKIRNPDVVKEQLGKMPDLLKIAQGLDASLRHLDATGRWP